MSKVLNIGVLLVFAGLNLISCARYYEPDPQLVASPDKASMLLAQAADRASVAIETLAAVEQAQTPGIAVDPIPNAPPALKRAITISWVGPVEPITEKLSNHASYAFQVVGNAPPVPLIVSLNVENMPVIDVLRSIGLQMGMRADLKVNAQNRIIEVHYAPNTGISHGDGF